ASSQQSAVCWGRPSSATTFPQRSEVLLHHFLPSRLQCRPAPVLWTRLPVFFPTMAQQLPPAEIADLLKEDRTFAPSDAFKSHANVRDEDVYARAERDPEAFWAGFADELEWFSKWTHVLNWQPPHAKWFVDGTLNVSVNCVDRHVRGPR